MWERWYQEDSQIGQLHGSAASDHIYKGLSLHVESYEVAEDVWRSARVDQACSTQYQLDLRWQCSEITIYQILCSVSSLFTFLTSSSWKTRAYSTPAIQIMTPHMVVRLWSVPRALLTKTMTMPPPCFVVLSLSAPTIPAIAYNYPCFSCQIGVNCLRRYAFLDLVLRRTHSV